MNSPVPKVIVSDVKEIQLEGDLAIVKVVTDIAGVRSELEIAITSDLAPQMALSLLATTAAARAERDDLPPALDAIAAGVATASATDRVRLQLLFDKGAVLPVELPSDAARALGEVLVAPEGKRA